MSYFSKKKWKLIKFKKSSSKGKKYDAVIENKTTGVRKTLPFGAKGYQHYRDSTGLGLFSHKNHLDKKRRENYKSRHLYYIKAGFFSPGYFSMYYLW